MDKKSTLISFAVLFALIVGMIIFKTKVQAPEVDMSLEVNGPANIVPIELDVETNQNGRKVLLISNNTLTFTGKAPGTMFFEASFPIYFEDEMGATVAQGLASANGDWMTTGAVPFSATLQFKPITVPVVGSIVFKRDNPSGLPEHDFELRMPAVLQNK